MVFPVNPSKSQWSFTVHLQADVDGSGRVDATELAQVLRRAGFTPITGAADEQMIDG